MRRRLLARSRRRHHPLSSSSSRCLSLMLQDIGRSVIRRCLFAARLLAFSVFAPAQHSATSSRRAGTGTPRNKCLPCPFTTPGKTPHTRQTHRKEGPRTEPTLLTRGGRELGSPLVSSPTSLKKKDRVRNKRTNCERRRLLSAETDTFVWRVDSAVHSRVSGDQPHLISSSSRAHLLEHSSRSATSQHRQTN